MDKITQGEWEVTKWASHNDIHISVDEGSYLRFVANCGNPIADTLPTNPDAEANAHLISAAPDMREALVRLLEGSEIAPLEEDVPIRVWERVMPSSEAILLGFQALAKARGEG